MLKYWIWLSMRPSVSEHLKMELLCHFGSPEEIFGASEKELRRIPQLTAEGIEALLDHSLEDAEKVMSICLQEHIGLLTYEDERYPERLKNIYDPPVLLYYQGTLPDFDAEPTIAVVGTRGASAYGLKQAQQMGYQIGKCGGVVVSGLADGIDSAAMNGALLSGCTVVGVSGCGIDRIYPRSSKKLYEDTRRFGCVISEYAPGEAPLRWHFPRRNRIISGLSCGVVIVEAPEGSGALYTARHAHEQNREIFVIPGNVDLPSFVGSNRLMGDIAAPVSCGWDVMQEYVSRFPDRIHRSSGDAPEAVQPSEPARKSPKAGGKTASARKKQTERATSKEKDIDKEPSAPYSDVDTVQLPPEEEAIVKVIGNQQKLVDEIIAETGLPTGKVMCLLTVLQMKHLILRHPGNRVSLKPKT